ncbi:TPA: hypothetical protein HA231_05055 [Candidatus Woesearchaeota archaeon]|nr:hypothetical protein [Candidatus Woesearchaeota archaeon]
MPDDSALQELYRKKQSILSNILGRFGKSGNVYASASHRPGREEKDLKKLSESQRMTYFHGTGYPSRSWYKVGGLFSTCYKAALIEASKKAPPATKLHLWILLGARVGTGVRIGHNVQIDYFYPQLTSIGNNVSIGDDTKLWNHDFSVGRFGVSFLIIEDGAVIGKNCIIGPVTIGAGAHIADHSVVLKNAAPGSRVDTSDPEYRRYAEREVEGGGLFQRFVARNVFRICKMLPYDPVPSHLPLLKNIPFLENLPALELKNKLYKMLGIKIGRNVTIAPRVFIDAAFPGLVSIGDGSLVGDGVIFRPYDLQGSPKPIVIGKNVKIGSESVVMGCTIGDNCQVNLRSVVIQDIPPNTQAAGVPAKPIRGI